MTISFNGLATGIDTASLIEASLQIEQTQIENKEAKQEYLQVKLDTYKEFNALLDEMYTSVDALNTENDLKSFKVDNRGDEYFSISTSSLSSEGTYSIEVVSLAQRQKDINNEYIPDTDTTLLSGELQIGDATYDYSGKTLSEIVDEINGGEYGISATMVDDGTEEGYKILFTADNSGVEIDFVGTGDITLDTTEVGHLIDGQQAHVIVDGLDYYSTNNSMTNAVHGATITLHDTSGDDGASTVTVESDTESVIATQLQSLVDAYNAINTYVSTIDETDPTLSSSMENIQRNLKSKLTSNELSLLGVDSNWETGELSLDTEKLSTAYKADPEGVITSLLGEDDSASGAITRLDEYLTGQLDSNSGFYVTKENSLNDQISRLDEYIESMEMRLEKRQQTLEAQYAAMEELVSTLNSQADYIEEFFASYNTSS